VFLFASPPRNSTTIKSTALKLGSVDIRKPSTPEAGKAAAAKLNKALEDANAGARSGAAERQEGASTAIPVLDRQVFKISRF
jgi:hypothetical protein